MRTNRPPHLGVLDDRPRPDEEVDVGGKGIPASERVGDSAPGEALGEDLRAGAVQPGVPAVQERRVGRDGQQQRQHRPQAIAHEHRAISAAHADVHVQRERVVAPGDVLEPVLDPVVVLGVDDLLSAVVRPRMGSGSAQRHPAIRRKREQPPAPVPLRRERGPQIETPARADLDLGGDQLAGDRLGQHRIRLPRIAELLEARRQLERAPIEHGELLLQADGEVRRLLEGGVRRIQVETAAHLGRDRGTIRSGRSRARKAGRRPGSRCGR